MNGMGTYTLLVQLANIASRSMILAAGISALLAVFRVRQTSQRLVAWKLVLYAALAMPALTWLLPGVSLRTPEALGFAPVSSTVVKRSVVSVQPANVLSLTIPSSRSA